MLAIAVGAGFLGERRRPERLQFISASICRGCLQKTPNGRCPGASPARRVDETIGDKEEDKRRADSDDRAGHGGESLHLAQPSFIRAQLRDQRIRQGECVHGVAEGILERRKAEG